MSASIVYAGVGGGGTLFQGKKFFLLQRVPSRNTWISIIEANGGVVTKTEKPADIIIADHARKDSPAGSVSWKWIDESAKTGRLLDLEKYRCAPVVGTVRIPGAGPSLPTRAGRVPFTAEDDRILMDWVGRAEQKGIATKGNELYKQLAEKNPRHTLQSWRDRWVKYLAHRPRPNFDDVGEEDLPPSRSPSIPSTARPSVQQNAGPSQPFQPIKNSERSKKPFVAKSKGGKKFTAYENSLLSGAYDDIANLDDNRAIDAWIAWAVEWPNHTAQEWRNQYHKHTVPMMQKGAAENSKKTSPSLKSHTLSASNPEKHPPGISSTELLITPKSPKIPRSTPKTEGEKYMHSLLTSEKKFKDDLVEVANSRGVDVDFNPTISGKTIPLFDLWQLVMSDNFGGFDSVSDRDLWPKVAKFFDYTNLRHSDAPDNLKCCYDEILHEFEDGMRDYCEQLDSKPTDSQEQALIESQLRQTAAHETQDEESSKEDSESNNPPRFTSLATSSKRGFTEDPFSKPSSSRSVTKSNTKRQRVEEGRCKGKELEIPSTPEEVFNNLQKVPPPYHPSPLKYPTISRADDEEDEDEPVATTGRIQQPKFSPLPRAAEPETQDFHFPPPAADLDSSSFKSLSSKSTPPREIKKEVFGKNYSENNFRNEASTQPQIESQATDAEFDETIERFVGLGYAPEVVIEALEAATMRANLATQVFESLQRGKGIPNDIRGVWTAQDDEDLEKKDYSRIMLKHGESWVKERKKMKDLMKAYENG